MNMHSYDSMQHKSEDWDSKMQKVVEKIDQIEEKQKEKIQKTIKKYKKIEKQNSKHRVREILNKTGRIRGGNS